jgi:FkbM family methyltransferase
MTTWPDSEIQLDSGGFNRCRRCRHGQLLFNVNDAHIGRSLDLYGEWAESELALLGPLLRAGDVVVDVGANIGTHTIFFARTVGPTGAVVAFEPQRIVFQTLCANVALNSLTNVHAVHGAAGRAPGAMTVPALDYSVSRNFGGVALAEDLTGERVVVTPIDQLGLDRCALLKVDVEGMELDVLMGAERLIRAHRPVIYLENNDTQKSSALISSLLGFGYTLFWHFSHFFNPANFLGRTENVFGGRADANMIAVRPEMAAAFVYLPRVAGTDDTAESALERTAHR